MARRDWVCALILGGFSHSLVSAQILDSAQDALLEVTVNGEIQPMWTLIKLTENGAPWVRRADLRTWGVQLADSAGDSQLPPDGLLPLNEVPGVHASVDRAASRLAVDVQPALLNRHEYHTAAADVHPMPSPLGAFYNYDLGAVQSAGPIQLRGLWELGMVRGNWVARSSWFGAVEGGQATNQRLDSNITADFPETRTTLQWGDTFARLGTNAEAVRIAGMSWGTDFSVTPTFITVPLPSISTVTATPSNVDLYVNGAKTQQLAVPSGPFSVSGIPVTTGSGELTVVTHDLLGHTQTFTQSYYISPQMLQAGLAAWDLQLGSKRLQYGIESSRYSGWLAAGGERYGITDRLTAQWRLEADETGAAAGAQWLMLTPVNALLSLSPLCSTVSRLSCLLTAGYERDYHRLGYGVDVTYSAADYAPVAAAERSPAPRWQVFSHVQAAAAHGLSFMLGGTWREQANGPHTFNVNFTAGKSFQGGHLDFVLSRTHGDVNSSYLTLIYTHSIDAQRTVSATAYSVDGNAGAAATLQRNLPSGNGFGYLLRAAQDASSSADAGVQWNGDSLAIAATAQREGDQHALSAEISGAALWLSDDLMLARHMDRSFAVVHAEGLPGQPIYLNDQLVTRTDAQGVAVLPDLRPFEANKIELDPTALPLTMDVPQTRFEITPYRRGGVYVDVPVQLAAAVHLRLKNGEPVPAGARIHQHRGSVPVGTDGMAYIEGAAGDNILLIDWDGGQCQASVRLPAPPSANQTDDGEQLLCAASP